MATFADMVRILGIAMFFSFATIAMGQNAGNPFDLKYRSSKPAPATTPRGETIDTVKKVVQTKKETSKPESIKRAAKDTTSAISSKPTQPKATSSGNPFEISDKPDSVVAVSAVPSDTKVIPEPPRETKELIPSGLKHKSHKGFQIFFVLLSLLFLIFIVNVERSFVRDLWKVISNENYSSLHHRNQRNTMRQILLMMGYAVSVFQTGLFIYHGLRISGYQGRVLDNIWTCMGLVLGVYLVRHGVIRYLRWLFNNDKEMTLFGFDISIFNTMVGLVLLPVNILLLFGPDSIFKPLTIIGVVAILAAYVLRQLRWMLNARQLITGSLFLFFVYLCTVEILPLWAISKLFW